MRLALKRALAVMLAAVMCVSISISVPVTLQASETYTTVSFDVTYCQTEARSILSLINEFRSSDDAWYWNSDNTTKTVLTDLSDMEYDYALEEIAMQRAAEIALSFSHTRPSGQSCFTATSGGMTSVYITSSAENIAAGYGSASSVFNGWKEENDNYSGQGHRRAMLSSYYTAVGIACVYYNGTYYWVQEFRGSNSSAAATTANDSKTTVEVDIASSYVSECEVADVSASYDMVVGDTETVPEVTATLTLVDEWSSRDNSVTVLADWSSGNSSVASVNDDTLSAVGKGTTSITASVFGTTLSADVTVKQTVANCSVTVASDGLTYNGSAKKPSLTVTDGDTTLVSGTDYTVSYSNNVNAGTATATITGKGDGYTGTKTVNFTIGQADIAGASLAVDTCTYNGSEQEPAIDVTYGSMSLTLGTDYTVTYTNNVNVGTATATITGKGNYKGTTSIDFDIEQADISTCQATLSSDVYMYDGTEKEPEITLTIGSYTLKEGTDYTFTYADNTEMGTASVIVTAVEGGNFCGSDNVEFYITFLGDANGDGKIDYLDAMSVLRYDAELIEYSEDQIRVADVNGDGKANSLDAILILRYDAGLITSF